MQVDLLKGNVGAKFREEMRSVQGEAETGGKGIGGALSGALGMATVAASAIGLAMVGAGVASLKSAADFQESMTQLVTGAGESSDNIKLVSRGILDMAGQVGVSAQDLASGMYMVESAGFHGAQGLSVLRAAAEGAKVGNADMATVANAVTSALNAYGLSGDHATSVTNTLVATVAAGKMHMQDLAGSLGTVLPEAASLKIGIADVSGAIATMTMQGTDAFTATQGLRFLMTSLVKTTPAAAKEMENFGLKSGDVAKELTTRGLQATLQTITDAVGKKFPEGSAQYLQAVATMVGGTRGLNTVLELTGSHMGTYQANIASISAGSKQGGKDVQGWADASSDLNTRLAQLSSGAGAAGIRIGTVLLPVVGQFTSLASSVAIPALNRFAEGLEAAAGTAQHGGDVFASLVPILWGLGLNAKTALAAGNDLRAGWNLIAPVFQFVRQNGDLVKAMLIGLAASFAAFKIISFAQGWLAVISAMRSLAATEGIMTAVNWLLGTSELFAMWPLLLIVLAIGAVIAVGYLLITHWKQVSQTAERLGLIVKNAVGGALSALGSAVHGFLSGAGQAIGGFFSGLGTKAHGVVTAVGGAFSALGSAVHGALMRVVAVGEAAWRQFSSRPIYWIGYLVAYVPVRLAMLIAQAAAWAARMVLQARDWAVKWVTHAVEAALAFRQAIINELTRLPGQAWGLLVDMHQKAHDELWALIDDGLSGAQRLVTAILDELQRLPEQAWSLLEYLRQRVVEALVSLIDQGRTRASDFTQAVLTEAQKLPDQMFQVGVSIVQGVINGIKSMISSGVGAIGDFVNGLVAGAKAAAGSHSPSTVFQHELGEMIPEGTAVGVLGRASVAQAAVGRMVASLVPDRSVGAAVGAGLAPSGGGLADGATETTQREVYDTLVRARDSLHQIELYLQRLSAGRSDLAWSMKLQ